MLPKFTEAVTACEDTEDTSQIKETVRKFIKFMQDTVFPDEDPKEKLQDPQEEEIKDPKESVIKKIVQEIEDLSQLDNTFAARCIEEQNKLDAQKTEF